MRRQQQLHEERERNNMATIDIGIDLGTANTVITLGRKGVVLSEPSAVAYDERTLEIIAIGAEAYEMI